MALKLLISLLTILHRGSLKREIAKEIKDAEAKKRGKSNSRIINLGNRKMYTLGRKNCLDIDI
jgi:hypothetical protein